MRRPERAEPSPQELELARFTAITRDHVERAGDRLRFRLLNDHEANARVGAALPLNGSTRALLAAFLDGLLDRRSTAVLQWPSGQRDVLLLHPLAMLTLICSSPDRLEGGQSWCDPVPSFRTLYFPWRGGATGSIQRSLLIDRQALLRRNARHLTRRVLNKPEDSDAMSKLHETIGHLSNLSKRDTTQSHLAYPTLAEIYPVFVADGGDDAPAPFRQAVGELYGRVRHGAAIDRLSDHRPALANPLHAPFGLFGVTARADPQRAIGQGPLKAVDICLLDLGPPALSRLGHGWEEQVDGFIQAVRKRHPGLPVLAVTQDSYVHRRVLGMLAPTPASSSLEASSRVLLRSTDDPLTPDLSSAVDLTELSVSVDSAGGAPAEALAAMSAAARGLSDAVVAGRIRRAMGGLRRAASLPCGLGAAHEWLNNLKGQDPAETFLERRSGATVLAPLLEALDGPSSGPERERLMAAEASVRAAFDGLEQETPVGSLLVERAVGLARKSTPSLLVFGTDAERKLADHRLASDAQYGELLGGKMASGKLRLVCFEELDGVLAEIEAARDRKSWKRLVLVAPTADRLSGLLIRPWLPDQLILICDHGLAGRIAATYGMMVKHPDIQSHARLAQRLAAISAGARREFDARAVGPVDLTVEARPVIPETDDGDRSCR